jgi:CHAT domain-containing protein
MLRILVVADPAADDHLPGAEEEGIAVARLFESFNRIYRSDDNRAEVVRLFGPSEATRTNVLRTVMSEAFDVLHYAGHCRYDPDDPARSGWVFTNDEILSAHELNRIDRIPKFVFSNACESGITPDRSEKRSAGLAPSFAESFFARGVANFVCTAWPVDDLAARVFALKLYGHLLGIDASDAETGEVRAERLREGPQPVHSAMHHARLAIMGTPNGLRTWGAYQHYGNPYFRLFDAESVMKAERKG